MILFNALLMEAFWNQERIVLLYPLRSHLVHSPETEEGRIPLQIIKFLRLSPFNHLGGAILLWDETRMWFAYSGTFRRQGGNSLSLKLLYSRGMDGYCVINLITRTCLILFACFIYILLFVKIMSQVWACEENEIPYLNRICDLTTEQARKKLKYFVRWTWIPSLSRLKRVSYNFFLLVGKQVHFIHIVETERYTTGLQSTINSKEPRWGGWGGTGDQI